MPNPIGSDLAYRTLDMVDLSVYGWTNFVLNTSVSIESGGTYAIVVGTNNVVLADAAEWRQVLSDAYPGGSKWISSDVGVTWTESSNRDLGFRCYAGGTLKDNYGSDDPSFWMYGAIQYVYGDYYAAQVFTAASSYTLTSVTLPLGKGAGTPSGTVTISIRLAGDTPTKAANPTPANAATNVTLDQATITWEDGGGADTFDVYYGTTSGNLTKVSSAQAGTSFTIFGIDDGSPFSYLNVRYWRIDATNDYGTTTGDEWVFTTIRFYPPQVTYWYSTGGYYYQLLVQADGSLGDPPPTGTENTDYVVLGATYAPNFIRTQRKLVAAANNKMWYEAT